MFFSRIDENILLTNDMVKDVFLGVIIIINIIIVFCYYFFIVII